MILKKLMERIHPHHNHHHHNHHSSNNNSDNRNQASSSSNSESEPTTSSLQNEISTHRNLSFPFLHDDQRQLSRGPSIGNILTDLKDSSSINKSHKFCGSSIYNEAENENSVQSNYFYASSTSSHSDAAKLENDFDELNLHHDHNTKHLYRNVHHSEKLVQKLNEMRKTKEMCDITLNVNGLEIPCHKYVLAANSSYFLAMFTNGLLETNQNQIEIKEIDSTSLNLLINYMYTGELVITELNVQFLLTTANLLNLTNIKEACGQFIQSQLDTSNCLGIREFADFHSCPILQKHADAFIEQYFSEVILKDEFLNLNSEQLINLISKDNLAVKSEKIIYSSIIKWINYDLIKRKPLFDQLMKHVRFPLMDSKDLVELAQDSIIKDNSQTQDLVLKSLQYKLCFPSDDVELPGFNIKPRVPLGLPKVMLIFGGQAPKATEEVEAYDFRLQKWRTHKEMPSKRCRAGCIYYDGLVYLIGGFNGQSRIRSVDIYNPVLDEWTGGVDMLCRRGTLGVGLLNNKIYACGGFDGMCGLMSAECYDPETKTWTSIANMSIRRSSVGVVSLSGYLYAIGGYCGASRECLDSCERFDPTTNSWKILPSMHMRRSGASVCVYDDKIYVAGGHDGPLVHHTVEVFDPQRNKWNLIAEMNTSRRNAGFIINNGLFYVLGGDDGSINLSSVEVYNPQRNVWSLLPQFLNKAKSYISCLAIDQLN